MSEAIAEELAAYRVDRTGWPPGPWDAEPDRAQWTHAGYACLLLRHPRFGSWCGYVGVDRAHPYYGKDWSERDSPLESLEVHGGVNYSRPCEGVICHAPEPGMPEEVFWLGFAAAHAFDIAPGLDAREAALGMPPLPSRALGFDAYRDEAYMRAEVERLAEQLRALR
jgi:hypothetical protein